MNKPIFLCDMDDTLFEWSETLVKGLNEIKSPSEPILTAEDFRNLPDWYKPRIELIKSRPNFYRSLPINGLTLDIWHMAHEIGYDCQILTKGPYYNAQAWAEKYESVRHHLGPSANVNIVMDKSIVYGAVLYDDYPPYVEGWLKNRPRGLAIMPDRPVNKDFSHPRTVKHYWRSDKTNNRKEIFKRLKKEYESRTN